MAIWLFWRETTGVHDETTLFFQRNKMLSRMPAASSLLALPTSSKRIRSFTLSLLRALLPVRPHPSCLFDTHAVLSFCATTQQTYYIPVHSYTVPGKSIVLFEESNDAIVVSERRSRPGRRGRRIRNRRRHFRTVQNQRGRRRRPAPSVAQKGDAANGVFGRGEIGTVEIFGRYLGRLQEGVNPVNMSSKSTAVASDKVLIKLDAGRYLVQVSKNQVKILGICPRGNWKKVQTFKRLMNKMYDVNLQYNKK